MNAADDHTTGEGRPRLGGRRRTVARLAAVQALYQVNLDLPAGQVTVIVREPRKAGPLKDRGADVRHADYDEPATLVRAFEGADTVLINGTNYEADPPGARSGTPAGESRKTRGTPRHSSGSR